MLRGARRGHARHRRGQARPEGVVADPGLVAVAVSDGEDAAATVRGWSPSAAKTWAKRCAVLTLPSSTRRSCCRPGVGSCSGGVPAVAGGLVAVAAASSPSLPEIGTSELRGTYPLHPPRLGRLRFALHRLSGLFPYHLHGEAEGYSRQRGNASSVYAFCPKWRAAGDSGWAICFNA